MDENAVNLFLDIYSKVKSGEISQDRLLEFVEPSKKAATEIELMYDDAKYLKDKFKRISCQKDIVVPDEYGTPLHLNLVETKYLSTLLHDGKLISTENFGWPDTKIKAGDKVDLYVYKLKKNESLSSFEIILFYTIVEEALMLGFHGLPIVYPENKKCLSNKDVYYSADYLCRLFRKKENNLALVHGLNYDGKKFAILARGYDLEWRDEECFLVFKKSE